MSLTPEQITVLRTEPFDETGNRLKAAMRLEGITQVELAQAIGFTQPYISGIARGRHETLMVENAHRFANHFGCSISDLFPARQTHQQVA